MQGVYFWQTARYSGVDVTGGGEGGGLNPGPTPLACCGELATRAALAHQSRQAGKVS